MIGTPRKLLVIGLFAMFCGSGCVSVEGTLAKYEKRREAAIAKYDNKSDSEVRNDISRLPALVKLAHRVDITVPVDIPALRKVALRRGLYSGRLASAIQSYSVYKGMPEAEMILTLGAPTRRNESVYATGASIQYVHRDYARNTSYTYVRDGKVSSWSNHT